MQNTTLRRSDASVDDEANDDLVFDHLVHHAVPITGLYAPEFLESGIRSPLLSHETSTITIPKFHFWKVPRRP